MSTRQQIADAMAPHWQYHVQDDPLRYVCECKQWEHSWFQPDTLDAEHRLHVADQIITAIANGSDESDASGRAARARACPTCNGQIPVSGLRLRARETVGLVCPTCGWDYGEDGEPIDSGASRGAV